jgi:hypothetical protein
MGSRDGVAGVAVADFSDTLFPQKHRRRPLGIEEAYSIYKGAAPQGVQHVAAARFLPLPDDSRLRPRHETASGPRTTSLSRMTSSTGSTKILPSPMASRTGAGDLGDRLDGPLQKILVDGDLECHLAEQNFFP